MDSTNQTAVINSTITNSEITNTNTT